MLKSFLFVFFHDLLSFFGFSLSLDGLVFRQFVLLLVIIVLESLIFFSRSLLSFFVLTKFVLEFLELLFDLLLSVLGDLFNHAEAVGGLVVDVALAWSSQARISCVRGATH